MQNTMNTEYALDIVHNNSFWRFFMNNSWTHIYKKIIHVYHKSFTVMSWHSLPKRNCNSFVRMECRVRQTILTKVNDTFKFHFHTDFTNTNELNNFNFERLHFPDPYIWARDWGVYGYDLLYIYCGTGWMTHETTLCLKHHPPK